MNTDRWLLSYPPEVLSSNLSTSQQWPSLPTWVADWHRDGFRPQRSVDLHQSTYGDLQSSTQPSVDDPADPFLSGVRANPTFQMTVTNGHISDDLKTRTYDTSWNQCHLPSDPHYMTFFVISLCATLYSPDSTSGQVSILMKCGWKITIVFWGKYINVRCQIKQPLIPHEINFVKCSKLVFWEIPCQQTCLLWFVFFNYQEMCLSNWNVLQNVLKSRISVCKTLLFLYLFILIRNMWWPPWNLPQAVDQANFVVCL